MQPGARYERFASGLPRKVVTAAAALVPLVPFKRSNRRIFVPGPPPPPSTQKSTLALRGGLPVVRQNLLTLIHVIREQTTQSGKSTYQKVSQPG